MLARTADSLYWLARYMERAENTARILLAGHRMASLASTLDSSGNEWLSTLIGAGNLPGFYEKYDTITPATVVDFLTCDPENTSSIMTCFQVARRNARMVRTALSSDVWNCLNETWYEAQQMPKSVFTPEGVTGFLEWTKERSQLFTGAYQSTMLRRDAYYFTSLGSYVERADDTARILDVKYYLLLPEHSGVGSALDYYQWRTILSSVSALRSYHWIYSDRLKPWLIAELLILRPEMPRSLRSCMDRITEMLDLLGAQYGGQRGECHRLAGEMHSKLLYGRVEDIFQNGLHEYLTQFIDSGVRLGDEVAAFYLR